MGEGREVYLIGGRVFRVPILMEGLCSNDDNGRNGPAVSTPHPVVWGGGGSPEGNVVADARPGGNGVVLHRGGLYISGGWQLWRHQFPQKGGGRRQGRQQRQVPIVPPYHPPVTWSDGRVPSLSKNQLAEVYIGVSTHWSVHKMVGGGGDIGGGISFATPLLIWWTCWDLPSLSPSPRYRRYGIIMGG